MKRAVIFAGQGAQAVGMARDLAAAYPECRALFEKADAALGFSLSRVCFEGPIEELTRSSRCQPALFVASLACYSALRREMPALAVDVMAGLSLGEWTALHAAGAIGFEDALRVLEARGRFMQEACDAQAGGMVSVIGLPVEELRKICAATGVDVANHNSPEQTVLSGPRQAIEAAEKQAAAAGAKRIVVLNVAGAFHSRLMAPAAERLKPLLAGVPIRPTTVPVVSNVTGRPHGGPEEIRQGMLRQIVSPVQWVSSVEWLRGQGVREYVECGPGRVLSGLIKRIDKDAVTHTIQDHVSLGKAAEALRSEGRQAA